MPESTVKLLQSLIYGVAIVAASWVYTTQGPRSNGPNPPGPNVAETFAERVTASFGGSKAEAADLIDGYMARQAVLASKVKLADTAELFDIYALASELRYGADNGRAQKYARLSGTLAIEAVRRGLLAPDLDGDGYQDEPIAVNREGWTQLFAETIEGLQ